MKKITFCILWVFAKTVLCQFAPPAGQAGTTAIHKDSSVFVAWANTCIVQRAYQDISDTSLGYTTVGDSLSALGMADGNVISLGDGGYAILTFPNGIGNGSGWDFAVFENAFNDTFLELAFVEVSSDGINYFRFPATSYTQDTMQIGTFGSIDATKINNLAGKYRANYGTPFDLQELQGISGLNIQFITHVKIIDVVGCIQNNYASFDQYGNKINDPWNTPFPSGGFDLDAIGVIHTAVANTYSEYANLSEISIYPNPFNNYISINTNNNLYNYKVTLFNLHGQVVYSKNIHPREIINTGDLKSGIYILQIETEDTVLTQKIIKN
jgi:hypothetical protein